MRFVVLIIISILSICYSCSNNDNKSNPGTSSITENTTQNRNSDSLTTIINDSTFIIHAYKTDELSIDITNHQCATNFTIDIIRNNETLNLDLNNLNIPFKTPEVYWVNNEMICIANWWSGSFGNYIFIPLNNTLQNYVYINKDIELADSLTNNIVYVDTVIKEKNLVLTVENLITRRNESIDIEITSENDEYPFYDSLTVKNETLVIWINGKQQLLDLKNINDSKNEMSEETQFDNIEGTYYDEMCGLTLMISKAQGEYYYEYISDERKVDGKVRLSTNEDQYFILENMEYAEDYFDVSLAEDNEEKQKEYDRLKKIGKRQVGIDCYYDDEEIVIQNYGNAMNYYVKLYDCGEKYIHLIKQ